jgi:acetyl esterase/lipase
VKLLALSVFGVLMVALVAAFAASSFTPWPRALRLREEFDADGERTGQQLAAYVPPGVASVLDQPYDPDDASVRLDVFRPAATPQPRLTVVWVHGGGWLAGAKEQIANYARILAGRGFTVVTVGYSLAPHATYPTPVRQVNAALGYLLRNAGRLGIDPDRLVLAGDSAGAQIALQVATLIVRPDYAATMKIAPGVAKTRLAGLLLYCGVYRMEPRDEENHVLRTEFWSYSGTRDFLRDPQFATAWVLDRLNGDLPPAFVSVGNGDDLRPHSIALADRLEKSGVRVERLIFGDDQTPPLPHEYQFDLSQPQARLALERSAAFLAGLRR